MTCILLLAMGGGDIESPQDTPVSNQREASALLFGVAIEIQKAVDEIPQGESCMATSAYLWSVDQT